MPSSGKISVAHSAAEHLQFILCHQRNHCLSSSNHVRINKWFLDSGEKSCFLYFILNKATLYASQQNVLRFWETWDESHRAQVGRPDKSPASTNNNSISHHQNYNINTIW